MNSALQKRRIGQPAFLRRLRNTSSRVDARPAWLNWNVASMAVAIGLFGVLLWFLSPILAPFRAVIPPMGGLDLSFIVAFLVIKGMQIYLLPLAASSLQQLIG